jgi:YD repeat-containing protein
MKKIILLVLCAALLLCGCAKTDHADPTNGSTPSTTPTDSTTPSDPTEQEKTVTASLLSQAVLCDFNGDETWETKSVLEYDEDYNLIGVKMYQGELLVCEITYDKDPSRPLVELTYDDAGEESFRTEYTYNEQGKELSCSSYFGETRCTYDEAGRLLTEAWEGREIHYAYDHNGNNVSIEEYCDGEWDCTRLYHYDDEGKLVDSEYKDADIRITSTYDEYGNLLETYCGDEIETYYENTYDNGKLVDVKIYENDTLDAHEQYDFAGNKTLYITYNGDGDQEDFREERDYNDNGKLTRHLVRYSDGEMGYENTTTYDYDETGLLTCMSEYYYDELITEYTPVYETVEVTERQAEKIAKTAGEIFLMPDNSP